MHERKFFRVGGRELLKSLPDPHTHTAKKRQNKKQKLINKKHVCLSIMDNNAV